MSIIISETTERECCQPKDLKEYLGEGSKSIDSFCQHCGQQFKHVQRDEGFGRIEVLVKIGLGLYEPYLDLPE